MENIPKLLPLWHSVTLRDTVEKKTSLTPMHIYVDHGGAGIDVHYEDGNIRYEELKSSVNLVNFRAETCALPLLPPNKINSLFEPCMEQLLKDKENEHEFFRRALGIHASIKRYSSMRDHVMKTSRNAQKFVSKGRYDKIKAPTSIVQLAENYPKHLPAPRARWLYTGGCLSSMKSSDGYILLHPVGRKLKSLAITPLNESVEGYKGIHADVGNQRRVAISGSKSKIYQISVAKAPLSSFSDFCCVRQKKMYHYIWLKQPGEENLYPMESYSFDEQLSDIKLSNYIPGEHIVVTVDGKLFLQDAEQKKTVWQSVECLSHDPVVVDNWWGCDFGSHPRSVLYADRIQFTALDLRTKGTGLVKILSLPNPFFQEEGEQILMNRRLDVNHFQHIIATDFRMFIFDERYPQQPMITWNHMLESVPLYCDVKSYKSSIDSTDLVVLLGSQRSQDIASFHISCSESRIQPFSLAHPCHVSSPRDSIRNLELQCVSLHDDVLKRTSAPLIGISVVPYDVEIGYSVIQLTSFGDVFHQEFSLSANDSVQEKTFRVEPGCALVPAATIMSRMSSWLEEAVVSKEEKKHERASMDGASCMFADREKIMEDLLSSKCAAHCVICYQPNEESADGDNCDDGVVHCNVCPRCGLHVDYGKKLLETYENFGVLAGPFPSRSIHSDNDDEDDGSSKELQLIDFDSIIDPLAKMVLKEWPEQKSGKVQDAGEMPDQENTGSFIFPERESFTKVAAEETLPLAVTPSSTKDSSLMHSLTLDEDVSPSQDLFPSQKSVSSIKNKPKRIKLSSSFGF